MKNLSTSNQDVAINNFGKNLILVLFLLLNFFAFISYNNGVPKKEVASVQIEVIDTEEITLTKTSSISQFPLLTNFRFY